jgi:hypothetical protein
LDGAVDVGWIAKVDADPSGVGKDMVRLGSTAFDEFIAQGDGKRNVNEGVAVDVTEFAVTHAKFCATETVWCVGD